MGLNEYEIKEIRRIVRAELISNPEATLEEILEAIGQRYKDADPKELKELVYALMRRRKSHEINLEEKERKEFEKGYKVKQTTIDETKKPEYKQTKLEKYPEVKGYVRNLEKDNRIRLIARKINRKGVFMANVEFQPKAYSMGGKWVVEQYNKLIGKKVLETDPVLMNDIVKFRKQILQHRISCDLFLHSKGIQVASVRVYSILIENGQEAVDYWHGLTIDPSSFKQLVMTFEANMRSFGIKSVIITQHPTRKSTIDRVYTNFTFA